MPDQMLADLWDIVLQLAFRGRWRARPCAMLGTSHFRTDEKPSRVRQGKFALCIAALTVTCKRVEVSFAVTVQK